MAARLREAGAFSLDFIPIKRRARHTRGGRAYTDAKTAADMRRIGDEFDRCALPRVDGPAWVRVDVFGELPKGRPKRVESEPYTCKPDGDNVLKCVLDALNGRAWADDKDVVIQRVEKHLRTRTPPRVLVAYGGVEYE